MAQLGKKTYVLPIFMLTTVQHLSFEKKIFDFRRYENLEVWRFLLWFTNFQRLFMLVDSVFSILTVWAKIEIINYCWKFFWNEVLVVKTFDNIVVDYCSCFLSIGYLAEFISLFNLNGNKYLGQPILFTCYSGVFPRKGNTDILLDGFCEGFVVLWLQPSWLIRGKYYYWQFYG